MASRMTRWLTRIQQQRRILLLLGLLSSGGSWLLVWPSAPVMTLPVTYVELLTWVSPHTLVLTREDRTELYPDISGIPHNVIIHGSVLFGSGQHGPPTSVSADGQWLSVITMTEARSRRATVSLWFIQDQHLMLSIPIELNNLEQEPSFITMSTDGQRFGCIIRGKNYEHFFVWDRTTREASFERILTGDQTQQRSTGGFDLYSDEPLLFRYGGHVFEVRQLRDDQLRFRVVTVERETYWPISFSISADRQWIAHGGQGLSTIRRLSDGQLLYTFRERDSAYHSWNTSVALSPDKRYLLSGSVYTGSGGGLFVGAPDFRWPMGEHGHLIDIATGQVVQRFQGGDGGVSMVAYSPDGQYVAMRAGEEVRVFRVQPQPSYLQALLALLGLLLLLLALGLWVWARR